MKQYLYANDKEYTFFEADSLEDAKHKVINSLDLSYNPSLYEVTSKDKDGFTIRAEVGTLKLRNHFNLGWCGNGVFYFRFK